MSVRNALLLLVVALGLSSCSYRMAGVQPLGESLRIVINENAANVVRIQGYLQREVADAVTSRLGWDINPNGSAQLALTIDEERISATGSDARGIANRWRIEVKGQVLLTTRDGNNLSTWQAVGYSSGLNDEASALADAAEKAGFQIATWLENRPTIKNNNSELAK